jgi:CRP-like cAMP-binding protein
MHRNTVDMLFRNGTTRSYDRNQLIYYQGDPISGVHFIEEGFVKAYTILDTGEMRTMFLFGPGEIFPLAISTYRDWQKRSVRYFYQTLKRTRLRSVSYEELRDLVLSDPAAMDIYLNEVARTNESILDQLEIMKSKRAIDKVSMLLPYLVEKMGQRIDPDTYQLAVKLSHQEIADLSGITRETATLQLKNLEKKHIIEHRGAKWRIRNRASI